MEHGTAPAAESTEDLTEERVARVVDSLYNHPRHRELLYKTLDFCDEERHFEEAEAFIEAQPERAQALQAPYTLVRCLVDAGGLALVPRATRSTTAAMPELTPTPPTLPPNPAKPSARCAPRPPDAQPSSCLLPSAASPPA